MAENLCLNCTDPGAPLSPNCDDCLRVSQPTILPSNSIAPCGASAFVTIAYLGCVAVPTFTVTSTDPKLTNASFTGADLHYDTTADAVPGEYYDIRFKALCDATGLEVQGILTVGIKDLCLSVECDEGDGCDKCDGICKTLVPDMGAGELGTDGQVDLVAGT